jgi:hypothetical protein
LFKKVCAWWVPKMLIFDQKEQRVGVCLRHLHWFELEANTFIEWLVACDETWVHHPLESQSGPTCNDITWDLHPEIQDTAVSWQDNDKCVLGLKKE